MNTTLLSPVFVPSKGRPYSKIFKTFPNCIIFVEPQDYESYRTQNPNSIIKMLLKNDQGISYVRQAILDYAIARNIEGYWMLDDDLHFFYEVINNRNVKKDPIELLSKAESIISNIPNVAQGSLEYSPFAWSSHKEIKYNSYCDSCVYMVTKNAKVARYRSEISLKEDRDFTMQLINEGFGTVRVSKYSFHSPKNGSNKGGLKKIYDIPGKEEEVCNTVSKIWGDQFCTVRTKKNGRIDLKINWKELAKNGQKKRI